MDEDDEDNYPCDPDDHEWSVEEDDTDHPSSASLSLICIHCQGFYSIVWDYDQVIEKTFNGYPVNWDPDLD